VEPSPPLRVRLSSPALGDELMAALVAGDCLCARTGDETFVVLHRAAEDEVEARTELGFFLAAWSSGHGATAELV
jgi:hypothetical protein